MPMSETPGIPVGTPQAAPPAAQGTNVLAIIGLVAAILGLLTSVLPFVGLGLSVLGLVLSIIGKKNAAASGGAGVASRAWSRASKILCAIS